MVFPTDVVYRAAVHTVMKVGNSTPPPETMHVSFNYYYFGGA